MAKQYGKSSASGQTMEERLAEENVVREKRQKKIRILIAVVFGIIGIVVMIVNVVRSSSVKDEMAELEEQVKSATAEAEGLRQKSSTKEQKTVEIKEQLYSADQLAMKLCDAQNKVNATFTDENFASTSDEKRTALINEIKSYIMSGDNWIWCTHGTWYSNTNFAVGDSYPVIFTCYDDKKDKNHDKLLAYVIATYDATNNAFSGVQLNTTTWVDAYNTEVEITDGPGDGTDTTQTENPGGDTNPPETQSDDPGQHLQDIIDDYDQGHPSEEPTEEVTEEEEAHG